MTKEQEEAIGRLRQIVKDYKGKDNASQEIVSATETVLSMLEEKDKQIDLMAKFIEERINSCPYEDYDYYLNCENECDDNYIRCWNKFFENKAKER